MLHGQPIHQNVGATLSLQRQMTMNSADVSRFKPFAEAFVRKYWEAIRSDTFSMPPNEPVEETLDELLTGISYQMELTPNSDDGGLLYALRMLDAHGDWWMFTFQCSAGTWEIVAASAGTLDQAANDLFCPAYEPYFGPLLRHVTLEAAKDLGPA